MGCTPDKTRFRRSVAGVEDVPSVEDGSVTTVSEEFPVAAGEAGMMRPRDRKKLAPGERELEEGENRGRRKRWRDAALKALRPSAIVARACIFVQSMNVWLE